LLNLTLPTVLAKIISDDSVDLEQAKHDYNMPLDVQNHDIIAIRGSNPPLIEKPAFPKASGKLRTALFKVEWLSMNSIS